MKREGSKCRMFNMQCNYYKLFNGKIQNEDWIDFNFQQNTNHRNNTDYPIISVKQEGKEGTRITRAKTRGDVIQTASSQLSQATFLNDAYKIWNKAPLKIKMCQILNE